jgi:hypothetical protein
MDAVEICDDTKANSFILSSLMLAKDDLEYRFTYEGNCNSLKHPSTNHSMEPDGTRKPNS